MMNNLRPKTVSTPRDAHSECNIPAPLRSGTRPDPTGAEICAHTFCSRQVEKCYNSIIRVNKEHVIFDWNDDTMIASLEEDS